MTRLILALSAVVLLACFMALGWVLHWLWSRSSRRDDAITAGNAALIARLHSAEVERDALQQELAALRVAGTVAPEDRDDVGARLEAATRAVAAGELARDAANQEAARWRSAYEAVIREDRDDP